MKIVDVQEASNLPGLLAEMESSGEHVTFCRDGLPVADLVPHQGAVSMAADEELGAIVIRYDPTEEATEDEWPIDLR